MKCLDFIQPGLGSTRMCECVDYMGNKTYRLSVLAGYPGSGKNHLFQFEGDSARVVDGNQIDKMIFYSHGKLLTLDVNKQSVVNSRLYYYNFFISVKEEVELELTTTPLSRILNRVHAGISVNALSTLTDDHRRELIEYLSTYPMPERDRENFLMIPNTNLIHPRARSIDTKNRKIKFMTNKITERRRMFEEHMRKNSIDFKPQCMSKEEIRGRSKIQISKYKHLEKLFEAKASNSVPVGKLNMGNFNEINDLFSGKGVVPFSEKGEGSVRKNNVDPSIDEEEQHVSSSDIPLPPPLPTGKGKVKEICIDVRDETEDVESIETQTNTAVSQKYNDEYESTSRVSDIEKNEIPEEILHPSGVYKSSGLLGALEPVDFSSMNLDDSDEESENEHDGTDNNNTWADDGDETAVDFEIIEDIESSDDNCCWTIKNPDILNSSEVIEYFGQFHDTVPQMNCLYHSLHIGYHYLNLFDKSNILPENIGTIIKSIFKQRHDIFAFIFIKMILGIDSSFGTDVEIPHVSARKTPDFIIHDSEKKSIQIYEFTVVANKRTGDFMKGTNIEDSVYRHEIKELQEQHGYTVNYFPIIFSTGISVQANMSNWSVMGFESDDFVESYLTNYRDIIDQDLNYLNSFSFDDNLYRDFPNSEKQLDDLLTEKAWNIKKVHLNKLKYSNLIRYFEVYDFTPNFNYLVTFHKNNLMTIRSTVVGGFDYEQAILFKNNRSELFKYFSKQLTGREVTYIYDESDNDLGVNSIKKHGVQKIVQCNDKLTLRNKFKFAVFKQEDVEKEINSIKKEKGSKLQEKFLLENIKNAISSNLDVINNLNQEDRTKTPPTLDDRRNSFLCVPEGNFIDIPYENGPDLKLNTNDIPSISARYMLENLSTSIFSKIEPEPVDEKLSSEYRSLNAQFYGFITNLGFDKHERIKIIKTKMDYNNRLLLENLENKKIDVQKRMERISRTNDRGLTNCDVNLRNLIKNEMSWGSNPGYKIYTGTGEALESFIGVLKGFTSPMSFRIDQHPIKNDNEFFLSLKMKSFDFFMQCFNEIKMTMLFNWLCFYSRVAYTLLGASNRSFNSKKYLTDNLGLSNCVIFVKGGKKITSTRQSKIFRIITTASGTAFKWQNPKHLFTSKNNVFEITPWASIKQQVLLDMISLPYKYMANYVAMREKYNESVSYNTLAIPTLLALHNRRKTEQLIHNMRYLIVNCIAEFSQLQKLLPTFAVHTYSAFDGTLVRNLHNRYVDYCKRIQVWSSLNSNDEINFISNPVPHPLVNRDIANVDDLSYIIYGTYMMSKSNYQQTLEQTINMQSIMETHHEFISEKEKNINHKYQEGKLYESDFSYSEKMSYKVGKILSSEIISKHKTTYLNTQWSKIMNAPIDKMANNKGLRYKGRDFFNHKGYYVVYKNIMENQEEFKKVLDILDEDITNKKKNRKLHEFNLTFSKEQKNNDLEKVIMAVVDKDQRAGQREIYVMDYNTKIYQHPIEKMFKSICEIIDNEIISIPSNKRAGLIHHKCFEYRSIDYDTYYLTMDCRKWAPRSNTDKYIYMILGMIDVLPIDFVKSVLNYFHYHSRKEIHTRTIIKDILLSNPKNEIYSKYWTDIPETGSSFFNMPYSFVMGIFNMLSSLFHAGVQLLIKDEIEITVMKKNVRCNLELLAHSDDSAGRLSIKKSEQGYYNDISSLLEMYENLQKGANHLMSLKKCNISKQYFELLSILYLNGELLPLMPKFLSNVHLTFTGSGISSDFKQIISKSIELMQNGSTPNTAYCCQLILSNMYRNFYRVKTETTLPSLGGTASSWPPLYLYYGSCVDEIRISQCNPMFYRQMTTFFLENMDLEIYEGSLSLKFQKTLRIPNAYNKFKKEISLPDFPDSQWFFKQNKTNNSYLNILWFRAQIDDQDFSRSLLNINEIKRAYDSLYMASGNKIIGLHRNYNIEDLIFGIAQSEPKNNYYTNYIETMYTKAVEYYKWTNNLEPASFQKKPILSYKPCTSSITNFSSIPLRIDNCLHASVELCRPELFKYLFTNKVLGDEITILQKFLEKYSIPNDIRYVYNFLQTLQKMKSKVVYFYSTTMSNERTFLNNEGLHRLIMKNYSSTEKLHNSTKLYYESKLLDKNFPDYIKKCVNIQYLFRAYKESRSEEIGNTMMHLGNRSFPLFTFNIFQENTHHTPFLTKIGSEDPEEIILENFDNWATWTERQTRIGNDWVGHGKFICILDGNFYEFSVFNRNIESVKMKKTLNNVPFTELTSIFVQKLLSSFNLKIYTDIKGYDIGSVFGISKEGLFGFFDQNNILYGIVKTQIDEYLDTRIVSEKNTYKYFEGNHYIELNKVNYKIETVDSLVIKDSRVDIYNLIDWEGTPRASINYLMNVFFSGKYGNFRNITYDKDELINNMLNTDIYKFYYKYCIENKRKISETIWQDILDNVSFTEDMMPIIFESLNISEIEKILPKNKLDNFILYKYYDINPENLYSIKSKINDMSELEAISYLTRLLEENFDIAELLKLPEIGDEREFPKYELKDHELPLIPCSSWISIADILSESIFLSYNQLKHNVRKNLYDKYKMNFTDSTQILNIFYGDEMNYQGGKYSLDSYTGLTCKSIHLHRVIEEIFSNKVSFIEFSRSFRGTFLRNLPRHPRYEEEWHRLVANTIKYFKRFTLTESEKMMLDSRLIRTSLSRRYKKENYIEEVSGGENTLIMPAVLIPFYEMPELQLAAMDSTFNNLNSYDFDTTKLARIKDFYNDFLDDKEEDALKKMEKNKIILIDNSKKINDPIFLENKHNIAVKEYMPLRNAHYFKHGTDTYFIYNLNYDTANNLKLKTVNFSLVKEYSKYIKFYHEKTDTRTIEDIMFRNYDNRKLTSIQNIDIRIQLMKIYQPDDPDSYDIHLLEKLKDEFRLDEETTENVSNIIFSKNTPITKMLKLRQVIKSYQSKGELDIGILLKKAMGKTNKLDISVKDKTKINLANTSTDGSEIQNMTRFKKEVVQFNCLTNDMFNKIMIEKLYISEGKRRHLIQNLRLLISQLKINKANKMKTASARVLLQLVEETKTGSENNDSFKFDEVVREYISKLTEEIISEETLEDIDKPEFTVDTWNFHLRKS